MLLKICTFLNSSSLFQFKETNTLLQCMYDTIWTNITFSSAGAECPQCGMHSEHATSTQINKHTRASVQSGSQRGLTKTSTYLSSNGRPSFLRSFSTWKWRKTRHSATLKLQTVKYLFYMTLWPRKTNKQKKKHVLWLWKIHNWCFLAASVSYKTLFCNNLTCFNIFALSSRFGQCTLESSK